ncbi:50S ribosomal protein P1 [Halorientalis pallida]|uniref:50S ribosomal protein P1 n=1 Tax=Halorientalis pallida TaxID=2479928 RepID=UPI003C6F340D
MEYVYAALILNETGEEINEDNITGVLEAAGVDVEESRVKALVAALEDIDIEEAVEQAAAVPAGGAAAPAGGSADAELEEGGDDEGGDEGGDEAEAEDDGGDDEDEGDGGEGLGELFG